MKRTLRITQIALWSVIAVLTVASGTVIWLSQNDRAKMAVMTSNVGGSFRLTTHTGAAFSSDSLVGKPYLAFFGFTHCPDICPITLFELTDLMEELGSRADELTVLLITVDPVRDTQDMLATYMSSFDSRIIALTGTQAETDAVVKIFAAYAKKVPLDNDDYTMEHTAGVYMMDSDGNYVSLLRMEDSRSDKLRRISDLIG